MASRVKRFHVEKDAVEGSTDIIAGSITYDRIKADEIQLEVAIPLGYIPEGLATDSTSTTYETKQYLLSAELLKHVKAAYFETDLQQLTGGIVKIELYDYDASASIVSFTLNATTKRTRSANKASSLVANHSIGARFSVTSAGDSGSKGGGASPVLVLVLGVS